MANQRCPKCGHIVERLVETALGIACPACIRVAQGAAAAKSLPGITRQDITFLDAVIGIALGIAVGKAIDKWF